MFQALMEFKYFSENPKQSNTFSQKLYVDTKVLYAFFQ